MSTIKCRAKVSKHCYDGKLEAGIYPDGMSDDGTWDGETVVCDPCYIAGGQPSLYAGDRPTRQEVVDHVNGSMGL
jgi:hypothetical protein